MTAELWTLWAIVTIALWVPHPISLTAARCIAPVIAVHTFLGIDDADSAKSAIASAICALVACLIMFSPAFGASHAQAGAYGDEQRHLLRVPVSLILPIGAAYLLVVTSVTLTPLWLVDGQWVLGGSGLVVAAALMWKIAPRMYQLSRRWLVFVPAGVVVHDPTMLSEVLMLRRGDIVSMQLAPADTQAIDLTGFTRGVPLQVQLDAMTDVRLTPFAARILKTTDVLHVQAFLVAPTRPRQVLDR